MAREAHPLTIFIAGLDVVKVSHDELPPLCGIADVAEGARALRALGPRLVVVTLGERGAYYDATAGQGMVACDPVAT